MNRVFLQKQSASSALSIKYVHAELSQVQIGVRTRDLKCTMHQNDWKFHEHQLGTSAKICSGQVGGRRVGRYASPFARELVTSQFWARPPEQLRNN